MARYAMMWQTGMSLSGSWPTGVGTVAYNWSWTLNGTKTLPTSLGGLGGGASITDFGHPEKTMVFAEKLPLHDLKRVQCGTTGYGVDPSASKPFAFMDGHAQVMKVGRVYFDDHLVAGSAWPFRQNTLSGQYFSPWLPRNQNSMAEIGFSDFLVYGWDID
jgi:hypothetical protein